jgi:hypothetical protein
VRVDSAQGVAAARTLTITGASVTAGEYIGFDLPGIGSWRVTGVASGAADGDGTFDVSGTDNTAATNIRAAINSLNGLKDWVIASGSTNSVVITALVRGDVGNTWRIVDGTGGGVGTVGLLTGGVAPNARAEGAVVLTYANLTASTDTLSIGAVTLTWVSGAPANENQVQIGGSGTAAATNLAAAINAHSQLRGIILASSVTDVVQLTYQCDPRAAVHIRLATNDGTAMGLTQPTSSLTLANAQITRSYNIGKAP